MNNYLILQKQVSEPEPTANNMTQEQLNAIVFYIQNGEVVESTYKEYLDEYGKDLTTSPRGVEDRMHIREVKEYVMKHVETGAEIWESEYKEPEEGEQDKYIYLGETVKEWQIWSWGSGGNHPHYTGTSFDNEEDAELYYYERYEWYIREKNWDTPTYYYNRDEAEAQLIQYFADENRVDFDVAKSIMSKKQRVNERREEIAMIQRAEQAKRRAAIKAAVPAEAEAIRIDDEFKKEVQAMGIMIGEAKSKHAEKIMSELLSRNGKTAIESDFWQVFRMLKHRAEK